MTELARTDDHAENCNRQRAACAEAAVKAYAVVKEPTSTDYFDFSSEPPQDRLADLLTDLRHWARQNELDFDGADRVGAMHFTAAVTNDGYGGFR